MICILVLRFQSAHRNTLQETLASTAVVCFLLLVVGTFTYLFNILCLESGLLCLTGPHTTRQPNGTVSDRSNMTLVWVRKCFLSYNFSQRFKRSLHISRNYIFWNTIYVHPNIHLGKRWEMQKWNFLLGKWISLFKMKLIYSFARFPGAQAKAMLSFRGPREDSVKFQRDFMAFQGAWEGFKEFQHVSGGPKGVQGCFRTYQGGFRRVLL